MAPSNSAADIFLHGTPMDWVTHAGGISSLLVAPAVLLIALVLWLRHASPGRWAWLLCVLPALVAGTEFYFELRRIAADVDQIWSRDWHWGPIYAEAYARLYFGIALTLFFLLFIVSMRFLRHAPHDPQSTVA